MEAKELKVKILGIVATPVKGGNCQYLVQEALKVAEGEGNVETELIHLQDYRIEYCIACEGCVRRVNRLEREFPGVVPVPVPEYNCGTKDDMEIIHKKMVASDGIIFGAPVYIGTVPGQYKTFIDRCRTFVHDGRLCGKVATSLTVAHFRHAGQRTTLQMMNISQRAIGLKVVRGASTVSTKDGLGIPIKDTRFAVSRDGSGMPRLVSSGRMVAQMAKQIKSGELVVKISVPGLMLKERMESIIAGRNSQ